MKILSRLFFLFCVPAIIWHTPVCANSPEVQVDSSSRAYFSPWDLLKYENLSYDSIISFIYEVEYGDTLQKVVSQRQIE
jgi:hypothetical protein